MKQKYLVTVVKRSCVTGNPVWLYRGFSKAAARIAYHRACQKEIERMQDWAKTAAQKVSAIRLFLSECLANVPINAELTKEQQEAVKALREMENNYKTCSSEFYDHIMATRRARDNRLG